MRKILIDKNLLTRAQEYARNPFRKRNSGFIHPKTKLQELADSLSIGYPEHSRYVLEIKDRYEILNSIKPTEVPLEKRKFDAIVPEGDLNNMCGGETEFYKLIVGAMRYEDLREKDFLPYLIALNIKSCIYCNSQLAVVVKETGGRLLAKLELDHHFPKSRYPFLCTSFFNLFPSCSACNRSKSTRDSYFQLYTENPAETESFVFKLDDSSVINYWKSHDSNDLIVRFDVTNGDSNLLENHNEMFCVQGIYDTQKDIIEELLHKKVAYSEMYSKDLVKSFEKLFSDTSIIKRLLLGNYVNPDEIHKRPMSKFIQDIAKQIKLIT